MRIEIVITNATDKDELLARLRDLGRVVEIKTIGFDPWAETVFVYKLAAQGFPKEKLVEERNKSAEWKRCSTITAREHL